MIRITGLFLKSIFPQKGELGTGGNTVSSGYSGWFTPTKIQNTGLRIFRKPQNPTENHSRILAGISRCIIAGSNSVVESGDLWVAQKRSSGVTFCPRCLCLSPRISSLEFGIQLVRVEMANSSCSFGSFHRFTSVLFDFFL